jgi:hypothetical protein
MDRVSSANGSTRLLLVGKNASAAQPPARSPSRASPALGSAVSPLHVNRGIFLAEVPGRVHYLNLTLKTGVVFVFWIEGPPIVSARSPRP